MKLSIVIPVYNSEKIIPTLINSINTNLKNFENSFEIILVNDFSSDQSWNTIINLSKSYHYIKGINLKKNYGQHSAIFVGLKYCSGDKIICMDDDMQHDPAYIKDLYNELDNGYDTCYVKYLNRKHSLIKIFISWLNNIFSSYLMNKSLNIYTSSFKGISSEVKNKIINNSTRFIFLDYWIIKNSQSIQTIKVKHKIRLEGGTNYKLRELLTLWSRMIFLIETKKLNLRSLIINFLKFIFKNFLKNYVNLKNTEEIIVDTKTF